MKFALATFALEPILFSNFGYRVLSNDCPSGRAHCSLIGLWAGLGCLLHHFRVAPVFHLPPPLLPERGRPAALTLQQLRLVGSLKAALDPALIDEIGRLRLRLPLDLRRRDRTLPIHSSTPARPRRASPPRGHRCGCQRRRSRRQEMLYVRGARRTGRSPWG